MSLVRLALRFALPHVDIMAHRRCLFFGPHPDDIEIGAGATAARLAREGRAVRFVICTDGRYGSRAIPPEELVAVRQEESISAAKVLGVDDVVFLPFSDGADYDVDSMLRAMAGEVADFQPDIIFAPDPWVASECHEDHLNVGRLARRLACAAPYEGIMASLGAHSAPVDAIAFYMSAKCNVIVKSKGAMKAQLEAIAKHVSQAIGGDIITYLRLRSAQYGLSRLCLHAEGFRALGATEMHCLPERG